MTTASAPADPIEHRTDEGVAGGAAPSLRVCGRCPENGNWRAGVEGARQFPLNVQRVEPWKALTSSHAQCRDAHDTCGGVALQALAVDFTTARLDVTRAGDDDAYACVVDATPRLSGQRRTSDAR